jgi:hypothetical protein
VYCLFKGKADRGVFVLDGVGLWGVGLWGLAQDGPSLSLGGQLYVFSSYHIKNLLSYWHSSVLPAPNIEAKADLLRLLRLLDQQASDTTTRAISSGS